MLSNFRKACELCATHFRQLAEDPPSAVRWYARSVTTAAAQSPCVPVTHPSYMIWGANTDVGKTMVSAGLARAAHRNKVRSTGEILPW